MIVHCDGLCMRAYSLANGMRASMHCTVCFLPCTCHLAAYDLQWTSPTMMLKKRRGRNKKIEQIRTLGNRLNGIASFRSAGIFRFVIWFCFVVSQSYIPSWMALHTPLTHNKCHDAMEKKNENNDSNAMRDCFQPSLSSSARTRQIKNCTISLLPLRCCNNSFYLDCLAVAQLHAHFISSFNWFLRFRIAIKFCALVGILCFYLFLLRLLLTLSFSCSFNSLRLDDDDFRFELSTFQCTFVQLLWNISLS